MVPRLGLVLTLSALIGGSAHAQSLADESDAHFEAAVQAYQRSDFEGALLHFMQSNRLSPNATVASNVGHAYVALKRYPEAYRWYAQAADLAEDADSRKRFEALMQTVEDKVVLFELTSNPPGATVYVDRRSLGAVATTPATIALPTGEHKFIFELDNHKPVETEARSYDTVGERHPVVSDLVVRTGSLEVAGMEGVQVYDNVVEGEPLCTTPCTVDLPVGQHVVQLAREGYRTQPALVSVEEGEKVAVEATPERITGNVKIDASVTSALVKIDGEAVGYTPVIARVPIGARTVSVEAPGYEPLSVGVEVVDGSTVETGLLKLKPRQLVTLASRVAEDILTAPSSVSVVSRSEMEAFGYPNVAEALRGVRGLSVVQADEESLVMVRGIGTASNRGTQTKALYNGVPLTDQLTGRQYVYARNPNLQAIEIQRGSGSVLYGSGALTGLVSLQGRGRITEPFATASVGTFGSEARAFATGGAGDDEQGAWLSVSGVYGDGDPAVFPGVGDEASATVEDYSPWRGVQVEGRAWSGDGEVWAQVAEDQVLITSGAEGSVTRNQAGDTVENPSSIRQVTVGANYRPALSNTTDLDVNIHFRQATTQKDATWQRSTAGVPFEILIDQSSVARWVGAGAQLTARPAVGVRVVAGAEMYRSLELSLNQDAQIWLPNEERYSRSVANFGFEDAQSVYAAYGVADVQPVSFFKASAGVRVDKWYAQAFQANPRLVGMWIPSDDAVVKAMVGRSFRSPVTFEQKYFVESISVPAQDLGPESGWSYELEASHRFDAWTVLASGWGATYNNVIVSALDPNAGGLRRYANVDGNSRVQGLDFEVRREFLGDTMFSGWYSYQRSQEIDADGNATQTLEQPQHLAAMKVVAPIAGPGLRGAVRVVYEGERPYRANTIEGNVPDAVLADFVLSGRSRGGSVGWRAGVYNALNVNFAAATLNSTARAVVPQTRGRTFMASLEITGRRDDD